MLTFPPQPKRAESSTASSGYYNVKKYCSSEQPRTRRSGDRRIRKPVVWTVSPVAVSVMSNPRLTRACVRDSRSSIHVKMVIGWSAALDIILEGCLVAMHADKTNEACGQ